MVEDILGLPPVQVSFSTPCDDLCFKAALDSVKNIVTTVAIIENQERDSDDGKKNHSLLTSTDGDNTSNYFSAETSGEKEEVSSTDREELMVSAISNEALPDLEEPPETEEVEEIDIGKSIIV